MKQSIPWCAGMLALALLLCPISGMADVSVDVGVIGDCFPDEPVYTPDMPQYHCNEGNAFYGERQYMLALEAYERALEIDPAFGNAYYGLAITYRALGCVVLALENYSEVIRLEPEYAQAYASRAELYQIMGLLADAEKDLDAFVALHGQYPVPYIARGDFFLKQNEYARAAEDYAIALERNPSLEEAYLKYAEALYLDGRTEEAEAALKQVRMREGRRVISFERVDRVWRGAIWALSRNALVFACGWVE